MGLEFSYDAKGYRKGLADSLKQKRAENPAEAKDLLEKERETLNYKVSADIKRVLAKIEAKKQGKEEKVEQTEPKEIGVETLKMTGSDNIERELELHILDISEQLPDSVKLLHDIFRLAVLDSKLGHLGIGTGSFDLFVKNEELGYLESTLKYQQSGWLLFHYYFIPRLPQADLQEFVNRTEKRKEIFHRECKAAEQMAETINREYDQFLNSATAGAYLNNKVFSHVVGADDSQQYDATLENARGHKAYLHRQNRYLRESPDAIVKEEAFDVHKPQSDNLWFHAGGRTVHFDTLFAITVLCDPKNSRFKSELAGFSDYSRGGNIYDSLRAMRGEPQDAPNDNVQNLGKWQLKEKIGA